MAWSPQAPEHPLHAELGFMANQVGRRFAELAGKRLQRGLHRSVAERTPDIMPFIDAHNGKPKPNQWVKSADGILVSVRKFCPKANKPNAGRKV